MVGCGIVCYNNQTFRFSNIRQCSYNLPVICQQVSSSIKSESQAAQQSKTTNS